MAGSGLKIDARREKILEILARDGQVYVTQLSELLKTSVVTIRSDLDSLEQEGLLERIQGGAVQTAFGYYNHEFLRNKQINADAKHRIGQTAATIVQDGDTLFMNGGTTTYYTALALKKRKNLIVVTNSITVAIELGLYPTFTVLLLGGEINPHYSFTCGTEALDQLRRYRATHAILSVDGICGNGISTVHPEEATIARTMIECAKSTIVVGDASKVGKESFMSIGSLKEIKHFITESTADQKLLGEFEANGISLSLV